MRTSLTANINYYGSFQSSGVKAVPRFAAVNSSAEQASPEAREGKSLLLAPFRMIGNLFLMVGYFIYDIFTGFKHMPIDPAYSKRKWF